MNKIKILLIDDHEMVKAGLKALLERNKNYEVAAEASNGKEALMLIEQDDFDIVLTDISMPVIDGIEFTKESLKLKPHLKIIALTMMDESRYIKQMLQAGASGYLLKNCSFEEINTAIDAVLKGENYHTPKIATTVMDYLIGKKKKDKRTDRYPLSDREKEVLHLIVKEYGNQEIADKLFISPRTVEVHKRNLIDKTGCKNIAGLVLFAVNNQLFDDI